ncbi:TylF/MycF/NovP-related O-methyltransferase [Polymorphospora sp. NPDC050346]|uniref:TylF/MycF/NovP-related O-methyltransferase n=1 Tax=Polymorphospora sp. NPDC050346 TaxID=3155780 RepID=UPI0034099FDD
MEQPDSSRRLAVIRLDGDLHRSTTDALVHLYPRLSPGGFVIVDDYGIPACAAAVHEFRDRHRITDPIRFIDPYSIYWRRTG